VKIACVKCGHENSLGAVFCHGCSQKIEDSLQPGVNYQKKGTTAAKGSKLSGALVRLVFYSIVLGVPLAALLPVGHPEIETGPEEERVKTLHSYKVLKSSINGGANKKISVPVVKLNCIVEDLIKKQKEKSTEVLPLEALGFKLNGDDELIVQAKIKLNDVIPVYVELSGTPSISKSGLTMEYSSVKLGNLPLPGACADYFASEINKGVAPFSEMTAILVYLQVVNVSEGKLKVNLKKKFTTNFNNLMLPGEKRRAGLAAAVKKTSTTTHTITQGAKTTKNH